MNNTKYNNKCHLCHKMAKLRCQACKIVYYCDKICQQKNWPEHKANCQYKFIHICLVDGSNVQEEIYQNYDINFNNWQNVELPSILDEPLKVKIFNKPKSDHNRNVAIYLLVNPNSGLAEKKWIDFFKNSIGILGFAYSSYKAFRKTDFWILYSYIYDLMDLYADNKIQYIKENRLTKCSFIIHKKHVEQSDSDYIEKVKNIETMMEKQII